MMRSPTRRPERPAKGRPASQAWEWFTVVVPKGGSKQHPDVTCNFCGVLLTNAQLSRSLLKHLAGSRSCAAAPTWVMESAIDLTCEVRAKSRAPCVGHKRVHSATDNAAEDMGEPPRKDRRTSLLGAVPSSRVNWDDLESAHLQIAKAIFTSNMPFRIVEKPELRKIFQVLCPGVLPTRQVIATTLLDKVYGVATAQMVGLLKQQPYLTLVTDGWTNPRNQSIFNFVLTAPGMRPVFWSSVTSADLAHNGENLCSLAKDAIKEIEAILGKGKIVAVVSDNASAVLRSWRLLRNQDGDQPGSRPYQHILSHGCAAHAVNLLVKNIFTEIPFFGDVLDKCRFVAKFVKNHQALEWRFGTEQDEQGIRRSLKLPVATRWYSHEICIKSVIHNKIALENAFDDDELMSRYTRKPEKVARAKAILADVEFWYHGELVLDLLAPITESIAIFEKNDSPVSIINDRFRFLINHAKYLTPVYGVSEVDQAKVLDLINFRWKFARSAVVDAASILDPHTKLVFDGDELFDVMHSTIKLAKQTEGLQGDDRETFRASLEKFLTAKVRWTDDDFAKNSVCRSGAVWWSFRKDFPKLWRFASKLFSIPASSAASERSWSVHGLVYAKTRCSLLLDRVKKLVYVYSNAGDERNPRIDEEDIEILLDEETIAAEESQ